MQTPVPTELAEAPETTLTLPIERRILEILARRRGHATIVDYITALVNQDDEAMWDEQFIASEETLIRLGKEALAEHEAGLTEEFDPDTDPDAP